MSVPMFASYSKELCIFDTSDKYSLLDSLSLPPKNQDFGQITWSGDGKWLTVSPVAGETVPIIKFHQLKLTKMKYILLPDIQSTCFYNWTNRYVVVGCTNGSVLVWDIKQQKTAFDVDTKSSHCVNHLTINTDDSCVASASLQSGELFLHSLKTNKVVSKFTIPESNTVSSVYFSSCKKNYIAASSLESTVCVWDTVKSMPLFKCVKCHAGACTDIALSPVNCSVLASVSLTKTLQLYDIREKKSICELQVGHPMRCIEMLSTGDKIAVGSVEGSISMYDLRSLGTILVEIPAHTSPVLSIKMETISASKSYQDVLMSTPSVECVEAQVSHNMNLSIIDILSPITNNASPIIKNKDNTLIEDDSFFKIFTPDSKRASLNLATPVCIKRERPSMDTVQKVPRQIGNETTVPPETPRVDKTDVVEVLPEGSMSQVLDEIKGLKNEIKILKNENIALRDMVSSFVNKKPLFHEAQFKVDHIGLKNQLDNLFEFCDEEFNQIRKEAQLNEIRLYGIQTLLEKLTFS